MNPNNPSGSLYSKSEISKILGLAATHNIPVAADEIYDRIIYDGEFTSVASLAEDLPIIGLNGFSKTYLMTGWRLGYMFIQDPDGRMNDVWDGVRRLSRVRLCAATPVQVAGIEALRGSQDHIKEMVAELKRRLDYSWKRVNAIPGFQVSRPRGAFYLFPRIELTPKWKDDVEFVIKLLKETGVMLVHGSGFDPLYGENHFRAVFLPQVEVLREAYDAIEDFVKQNSS